MDRKLKKQLRDYQRKEEGITVIVSPKELQLMREAIEVYVKCHADEMMLFEYQLLLDDIDEIERNRLFEKEGIRGGFTHK